MDENTVEESARDGVRQSELAHNLNTLYLRAETAMELRNWPYAISLLHAVLAQEPGFLEGRKRLRMASLKNVGERRGIKLGGEALKVLRLQGQLRTDPLWVIDSLEREVLAEDPRNVQANELLFEAAVAAGLPLTAGFALETVLETDPENLRLHHKLGDFYMEKEAFGDAARVFGRILEKDGADLEASKKFKDAMACGTMAEQHWEEDTDWRELMANRDESRRDDFQRRVGMTTEMLQAQADQLAAELAHNGSGLEVTWRLAETYERLEQFETALPIYETALQLSGNDPTLEKKVAGIREMVNENYLRNLRRYVEENPELPDIEEIKGQLAVVEKARITERIAEARALVERNPTDHELRFELGCRLYEAGEYKKAIRHLQKARRSPKLRLKVMNKLGQCYAAKNMTDLAIRQYEGAIADLKEMNELKMDLLYNVALLYKKLGEEEKYLEAFKQIYDADCDYRGGEVAERVEKSYDG